MANYQTKKTRNHSKTKRFPIDIIPYLPAGEFKNGKDSPEFKDKIQIAIELFDNAIESLDISDITFDTWHASNNMTNKAANDMHFGKFNQWGD